MHPVPRGDQPAAAKAKPAFWNSLTAACCFYKAQCLEAAFHFPDKAAFLRESAREILPPPTVFWCSSCGQGSRQVRFSTQPTAPLFSSTSHLKLLGQMTSAQAKTGGAGGGGITMSELTTQEPLVPSHT